MRGEHLGTFTFRAPAAIGRWSRLWVNRQTGRNWVGLRKLHQEYKAAVMLAIRETVGPRPVPAFVRADITYCWVYPNNHRRDFGGLYSAAKYLDDALVDAGLLADDSVREVRQARLTYQVCAGAAPHIIVTLHGIVSPVPHPPKIPAIARAKPAAPKPDPKPKAKTKAPRPAAVLVLRGATTGPARTGPTMAEKWATTTTGSSTPAKR